MRGWLKFVGVLEIALLVLALIGPGSRVGVDRGDDHGSLARLVFDEPGFWGAVAVNFVALNIFIVAVLIALRLSRRRRRD